MSHTHTHILIGHIDSNATDHLATNLHWYLYGLKIVYMKHLGTNTDMETLFYVYEKWNCFFPALSNVFVCEQARLFLLLYFDTGSISVPHYSEWENFGISLCVNWNWQQQQQQHQKELETQYTEQQQQINIELIDEFEMIWYGNTNIYQLKCGEIQLQQQQQRPNHHHLIHIRNFNTLHNICRSIKFLSLEFHESWLNWGFRYVSMFVLLHFRFLFVSNKYSYRTSLCNCSYQTNEKKTPFGRNTIFVGHMKKTRSPMRHKVTLLLLQVYIKVLLIKKKKKKRNDVLHK